MEKILFLFFFWGGDWFVLYRKYVQKTRETERLWRHWYRNDCKLGPKFWRMDGPVISNWKRLIIFLGDFSVLQKTKIEGMEEHGLLQMTIWMIRPPLCSSVPLQMVICKEDGPPDDQHFFGRMGLKFAPDLPLVWRILNTKFQLKQTNQSGVRAKWLMNIDVEVRW